MPDLEPEAVVIDYREDPIGAARQGVNPTVLGRLRTGWAVMAGTQHLPGYCILLYDGDADQLTELPMSQRVAFMRDVVLLGEAVERACRATDSGFLRINYEILGNTWPHLHGHVHARYQWEPDELRIGPVYGYGAARAAPQHQLDSRHDGLRNAMAATLRKVLDEAEV
ncbi:HIT family protein [Nocardia salmonicida]|uniref:HIT family protein n=1 Tax=Nocardia salmonicida TaxID=53431 RepID=UPI0036C7188B